MMKSGILFCAYDLIVLGSRTTATEWIKSAIAIGQNTTVGANSTIAMGDTAKALDIQDIAIGRNALADGGNTIAIGVEANATEQRAVAIGLRATASDIDAVAIGRYAGYNKTTGRSAVVIGADATASGTRSFAIQGGTALAYNSTAFGTDTQAGSDDPSKTSIAEITWYQNRTVSGFTLVSYGGKTYYRLTFADGHTEDKTIEQIEANAQYTTTRLGANALAFGRGTKATNTNATAFGELTTASGEHSTAFGWKTQATSDYATSFGFKTQATDRAATAFGWDTKATNQRATAFGNETKASGRQATAFGYKSTASGENATAWGSGTQATGGGATAWGTNTQARAETSTAWGNLSIVYAGVWNDSAGNLLYDDVEVMRDTNLPAGQQYYIEGINVATGVRETIPGQNGIATREEADNQVRTHGRLAGYNATAFGLGSKTYAENSLAALGGTVGKNESGIGINAAAIGKESVVLSDNAYAIGSKATIGEESTGSVALGGQKDTQTTIGKSAANSFAAIGGTVEENATNAIAIGGAVSKDATSAIAIGQGSSAQKPNATALGQGASASIEDSVALGSSSVAARDKANGGAGAGYDVSTGTYYAGSGKASPTWTSTLAAVSVGGDSSNAAIGQAATTTRQLTGLAAGTADTDAVNVAQLKQLQWNIGTGTTSKSEPSFLKPVGGAMHDVVMRAGDGVRITATERTSGYDIEFNSYFTNLETTVPGGNFIDSITYKGKPYYINGGGSGIVDAISDNRAVIVAPESVDILNDQGEVTGKKHYLKIHSPYININGLNGDEFYDEPQDYFALAQKSGSMAIGIHSKAAEENSTAIGHNADAMGLDSTAIGYNSHAHGNNSVAIGIASTTSGNRAIAIGTSASNTSNKDYNPTNPHQGARAAGMGAIALGDRAMVLSSEYLSDDKYVDNPQPDDSVNDAIAIGTRTQARARNAIAVGGDTSYTYKDETGKIVTIYGADDDVQGGRNYGAVVGDGAHSGIAIGGAYGTFDNETKTIHQEMDAAATYGIRGIAIGSGALVANPDDFADLKEALSDPTYVNVKRDFHTARSNHLEAKAEWDAIKDLTINDPSLPEGMRVDQIKYDAAKEKYESTLQKMNEATAKYSMALKEVVRLQVKDSVLEEDAIAIGTLANASIRDSVALGSHSITDSNDKAGSRTGISGYDPLGKASDNDYFRGDNKYSEDDPVWRSTAGSLSVGGTYYKKDTNGNYETDDDGNLVVDKVITRRISHVAAGVKDSDAVNVAQLKRATTISSDSRNTALGVDENGNMIVNSPFLAISGVEVSSDNNTIVRKYRNSGGADGYVNGLQQESDEIQGRIDSINATRAEIDKALNGYTDGNGKFVDGIEQKYEKRLALEKQYKTGQITRERYLEESADLITVEDYTLHKTEYTDQLIATEARLKDLEESQKVYTDLLADNGKKAKEKYTEAETYFNSQANADGTDSMAVGHKSKAGGKQSIAIGKNNEVGTTGEIENKDSEAIKAKREKEAANSVALGIGNKITGTANTESSTESMTLGVGNTITNANKALAIGSGNIVEGDKSLAIGTENEVYGTGSGAIGDPTIINANNSYSIGNNNTIGGKGKGEDASVTLNNVFILGNNSSVDVNDTVVLGSNIHILEGMPESSVFLGNNAGYTSDTNVTGGATGTVSNATVGNITFGGFAGDTANGIVSVGYQGEIDGAPATTVRRIQNVAAGLISAESTDAINGSQLYAAIQAMSIDVKDDGTTTKVDKQTTTGGGGGGTGTAATTYTVKGSVTTIERGTNAVANNNLTLKEEKTGDPTSYKYTIDMSNNLKVDSVTAGDTVINNNGLTVGDTAITKNEVKATTFKAGDTTVNSSGITINNGPSMTKDGIDMKDKKITNVQAGEADTDAVNYGQLKDYVANNNQAVTNLGNQITGVENRMKKGLAGAAALAALHPMDFDPDDKLTFAAGMGHYRGESAAALGMFYRPDEKVMFSVGGTLGNGENMVNAGVSFSLDRTSRVTGSRTALTKEVVQLREHVAKQDAQIAELTALVRQLAGNAGLQVPASSALPTEAPALFADNLDNKWVYDTIEDLEQRGYFNGYAGRALTRQQIAAALDMAMSGGAKLDERIVKEFEPELSHVRVAHVEGKGNEEGEWYERPRASHDKYEDKHKIEKKPFRVEENKQIVSQMKNDRAVRYEQSGFIFFPYPFTHK